MKTKRSIRITSASCVAGLILTLGIASSAQASESFEAKTPSVAQQKLWDVLEVPEDKQEFLSEKISSGEILDADNGLKSAVGTETETVAGYIQTTQEFEDGSVAFSFVETPSADPLGASDEVKLTLDLVGQAAPFSAVQPRAVGKCLGGNSGSGYSTWRDCLVTGTSGALSIHFRATYTFVNGVGDTITDVNSPMSNVTGGTATTPSLKIKRAKETSSAKAQARATSIFDRFIGGTSTHILALNVGGNTATTSWI